MTVNMDCVFSSGSYLCDFGVAHNFMRYNGAIITSTAKYVDLVAKIDQR